MSSTNRNDLVEHFIGIDVSKDWLDCYLRPKGEWMRCDNTQTGFDRIDEWLLEHGADPAKSIICIENTGIYDDRLLKALTKCGWVCAVEKTTVLEKVTPDHHRKDDRFDAAGLAEYADRYLDKLTIWTQPEENVVRLRQLYSERRRLVTQKAAVQSKCTQSAHHTVTSRVVEQSWQQQLIFYQQQIQALEEKMSQLVANHPVMSHYYQHLMGIPGVGKVTVWLWLILFYGQTKLNSKKIASRFGFAPHSNRSGSSVRGKTRSSGHGASEMRQCMSLAARSVSTHYERFKAYKQRKLDEGKIWPIIRNNLINKLIKIICAIWNSGKPYDPDHVSRFDRQKKTA